MARVSKERPRLKAFCRVAFSVRLKLRAMLAARVFLPANRFNVRMSRLVHARLFMDVLRGLKTKETQCSGWKLRKPLPPPL